MDLELERAKNIHLVGIGGCGVSGLARILHEMGFKVSGSDLKEGPNTIRLKDLGVKILIGHEASQVRDADVLVYSSAVGEDNPEMKEARAKGIKIVRRAEVLAWIMARSRQRIAVAGTHGKTTTTAMIARVMDAAKLDPTFLIGCDMDYADGNARLGAGQYFVAEADESDSSFLYYAPTAAVITNIEADHMEHFGSMEELFATFEQFAEKVDPEGFIAIDGTDPNNQHLRQAVNRRFITYGLDAEMQYGAIDLKFAGFGSTYTLLHNGEEQGQVALSVPGWQNVLNSLAVFAVCQEYALDFATIAGALQTFCGARRRFSTVGEQGGVLIIDDYAHHPTEIKATLAAARSGWPGRRIVCVFQPHRYTRTFLLKDQFALAFGDADQVIITDIYAASEQPIPGVSGKTIADQLPANKTTYLPKKEQIAQTLAGELRAGDIVLTLGAGDIFNVGKELLARLKMKQ
ncbi:MAG: UDP-N-acetylmuramate--L-alanine ligase [Candidatus Margulisbacteria bacterium]|jgi:UDP-N-acetylmuramate--alanine ligase|nr:UDP-N-acetylmuramate--L-alanine ligase [Candidatus Margulisiibacteriota bacterium]